MFDQKENTIKHFGLPMKHIVEDNNISITNIHDTVQLKSPPGLLKQPLVILDLNKLPENKTHPLTYQENSSIFMKNTQITHTFTQMALKTAIEPDVEQFLVRKQ